MLENIAIHFVLFGEEAATSALGSPLVLFTASVAWATLWIQFAVLPFYNRGELLHKDYWASGRLNAVSAALEAGRLIPALSRMFVRAMGAQSDKRKRPEHEIEALLQSVEFLPDLKDAQSSMSAMDELEHSYKLLKVAAARIWKWGFGHTLLTPVLPAVYVFLVPLDGRWIWGLAFTAVFWVITLGFSVVGVFRFHSQLGRFTSGLEVNEGT